MIYCHTTLTRREAVIAFKEYVKENEADLVKVSKINLMTLDKNGNQHHFMTIWERADKWCWGRTYMWNGKMYHENEHYEIMGIDLAKMEDE